MAAAVVILLLTSCGAGSDNVAGQSVASNAATENPGSEDEATDSDEPRVVDGSDPSPRIVTFPALGGLRAEIAPDILVSSEGDFFTLRNEASDGVVLVTRTSQTGAGDQIVDVEELLAAVAGYSQAEVTVADDTIEALGATLTLHEFRGGDAPPGPGLFSGQPFPYGGNSAWSPGPLADIYLGEITGGVLAIAATAQTDQGLMDATAIVLDVAPTLSFTTADGLPAALPEPDQTIAPLGDAIAFEPASIDPAGSPELTALFAPVEPGQYQMGNLSVPITVDFDPNWFVALNFPTFVVFTELPPVGPGFRDIVFQQGANAFGGYDNAHLPNGEPTAVGDIDDLVRNPPPGLVISNIDFAATVGGVSAVQFDVQVDPTATCQLDDPCEFALTSPSPDFAKFINPGVVHRMWWIADVPAGPLVISAAAAEADTDWLDTRAQSLLDKLLIDSNE